MPTTNHVGHPLLANASSSPGHTPGHAPDHRPHPQNPRPHPQFPTPLPRPQATPQPHRPRPRSQTTHPSFPSHTLSPLDCISIRALLEPLSPPVRFSPSAARPDVPAFLIWASSFVSTLCSHLHLVFQSSSPTLLARSSLPGRVMSYTLPHAGTPTQTDPSLPSRPPTVFPGRL